MLHLEDGVEDFLLRYKRQDRVVTSAVLVEPVIAQARPPLLADLEIWTRLTYRPKKSAAEAALEPAGV